MASQRSANCTSWGLKNGQRSAVRSRQQQEAVSGQQSAVRDQRLAARGQRSVRSPPVAASSRKVGDLRHASRSPVTAAAVHTAPACRPPIRDAVRGQLSSSRSAAGRQQSAGQAGGSHELRHEARRQPRFPPPTDCWRHHSANGLRRGCVRAPGLLIPPAQSAAGRESARHRSRAAVAIGSFLCAPESGRRAVPCPFSAGRYGGVRAGSGPVLHHPAARWGGVMGLSPPGSGAGAAWAGWQSRRVGTVRRLSEGRAGSGGA